MTNLEKYKEKLPTVAELFDDNALTAFKAESINAICNNEPKAEWVKTHPFIKNWKYLPIDKIEFLLQKIFKVYSIEVIKTGMLLNAVEVSVRVHYLNPSDGQMHFHDGVGACEVQTQKDTGSLKLDMSNINRGAISMALPIAKAYAIKDACDHFGKLFGRDLNRKDTIAFEFDKNLAQSLDQIQEEKQKKRIIEHIEKSTTEAQLNEVAGLVDKYELNELFTNKKNTIC